jgi:arginase
MVQVTTSTEVHIIGAPLDHGAGRRGVGMGPSALRIAGLRGAIEALGLGSEDRGDIVIPAPETRAPEHANAKYLSLITEACRALADEVRRSLERGAFPLVIGGDHSMAIGTISGIAAHMAAREGAPALRRLGVLWFDAHADINTPETSRSGNIHGMPVACLLGRGPESLTGLGFSGPKLVGSKLVQIGLRDIDARERAMLADRGVHTYTMSDIDRLGMAAVMERSLEIVTKGTTDLHVSFDIDSLDPRVAPGTGTPSLGGLTYREAHLALEMIASSKRLTSMELAEVNPILDQANQTAELAVGLISSALGQRIL